MTDYLRKYAPGVPKFQMGGEMAPAEPAMGAAPAEQGMGGGEPDLQAMLMEFAQSQDPQLAVQICNLLLEMMQGQGGAEGGAPAAGEATPMAARGMAIKTPVFRKGGKLLPRY